MKLIEKLSNMIAEEIEDSEKYAKCALTYKDDHPELARTFLVLSEAELDHVNKLHNEVTNLINEYRRTAGDPPERMKAIYDYLHEKQIDKVAEVKVLHDMFRR